MSFLISVPPNLSKKHRHYVTFFQKIKCGDKTRLRFVPAPFIQTIISENVSAIRPTKFHWRSM